MCASHDLQVQKLGVAVLEHPSLSHIRLGGSPVTGAALLNVAAAVASGALTELALTSSEVGHSFNSMYTYCLHYLHITMELSSSSICAVRTLYDRCGLLHLHHVAVTRVSTCTALTAKVQQHHMLYTCACVSALS
jgi:hypothetical protein